jgi:hypothetical protein
MKNNIKTTPTIILISIFILLFSCRFFKGVFTLNRLQAIKTNVPRRFGGVTA